MTAASRTRRPCGSNGPHGLFKYNGNLYFADTNNNRIRTITPNSPLGTIDTIAGSSLTPDFGGDSGPATSAMLNLPNDVAVDSSGNVYIADTGNCRIRKITGGTISTIAGTGTCDYNGEGTATSAQLNHPYGVAVDGSGNVFIADTDNHRIRKITRRHDQHDRRHRRRGLHRQRRRGDGGDSEPSI